MVQGEAPRTEGVLAPASNPATATNAVSCHLVEVRIEGSSVSSVGFSEPCSVCSRRKRRAIHPPTRERKKVLVIQQEEVSPDDKTGCRRDIRGSVFEHDNDVLSASALSEKEVVGDRPPNIGTVEKTGCAFQDKKTGASATESTKPGMAAPGSDKKPYSLIRDEEPTEMTVRVNGSCGVVLTGGNLERANLSATCKCQAVFEIVF